LKKFEESADGSAFICGRCPITIPGHLSV